MFLMRCLFTMFAESVGLLPENSFKEVLARCEQFPETFPHDVGQLWEAMDLGTWAHALRQKVLRFNGEFFRNRAALPLAREEIGELRQAASHNWRNKERAKEEARGLVRWLRPEYQIPRFGTAKEKAELELLGGAMSGEAPAPAGPRPSFPSDDFAQTAAVMAALAAASAPLDAAAIAAGFKQSRKIAPKVSAVLAALARTGYVSTDGARFSLRRAV